MSSLCSGLEGVDNEVVDILKCRLAYGLDDGDLARGRMDDGEEPLDIGESGDRSEASNDDFLGVSIDGLLGLSKEGRLGLSNESRRRA
jgi:hypothetical protein